MSPARRGLVAAIETGSPAAAAGIMPDDRLLSLDGNPLRDIIDYRFYLEPGEQQIEFERDGSRGIVTIDTGPGIDPGIEFDAAIFDHIRTCRCRCVFCFVDQLPPGLRRSLYVKDDDFRLSFLYGNFITLNSLRDEDARRILEQRLSPLYVSVHACDPAVRGPLMGVTPETAARGLAQLRELGAAGIRFHIQIVLCPGINDRHVLADTIAALADATEFPGIESVGIVPVAVSPEHLMHHAGLFEPGEEGPPPLRPVTGEDCRFVISQVQAWQERYRRQGRGGFVYAADEFYLRGGEPLPPVEAYDDFAQFENGVGIAASFREEAADTVSVALTETAEIQGHLPHFPAQPQSWRRLCLLTGTLAAGLMGEICRNLQEEFKIEIEPLVAENRIFGPYVTVTGLLGGEDILSAAATAGLEEGDLLLIPSACLDTSPQTRFLDDLTLEELRRRLPCAVWTPRQP